jgi:hypothetical protein
MFRGHEDYDPNDIAAISQAKVVAALIGTGKLVLLPCHQVARYDLVFEEERKFYRAQVKTGQIFRGAVCFRPQSLRAAKRETGWRRVAAGYQGEIDYFGVYCPDNDKVYLVPIQDVNTLCSCSLRIEPAQNNQRKRVRWAEDYEVRPPRWISSVD